MRPRPTTAAPGARGFTLVEAMVALSLLAILASLVTPGLQQWTANARMRAVAESLQTGLRLARADSLRRSRQVVFSLTQSSSAGATVPAVPDGRFWAVHALPTLSAGEAATLVQSGVVAELGTGVRITGPASICFSSLGRLVANGTTRLTAVTGGATCAVATAPNYDVTLVGASRRLRVTVALGGQVRMCDPDKVQSAFHPDGCP